MEKSPGAVWLCARRSLLWDRNGIGVHGNAADAGEGPAIEGCAVVQGNRLVGHDGSFEGRGRAEGCRRPDLPEDVGSFGSAAQSDLAARGGGKGRGDLEDEDAIGISLRIKHEVAGRNLQRTR